MLNLLYDVSLLGIAQRNHSTFGLSRTNRHLLDALCQRDDVSVTGCSSLTLNVWVHSRLHWIQHSPRHAGQPRPWLHDGLRVTCHAGTPSALTLNEHAVQQQLQQLKTHGALTDGTTAVQWHTQLVKADFQGVSQESLSGVDVYHSSYYAVPEAVRRHPKCNAVLTVHDIIPVLHPEWCGQLGQGPHRYFHPEFNLPATLATITPDTWVMCPSQSTRNDLCGYLGRQIDPDKVQVIAWAASDLFYPCTDELQLQAVRARYRIPDKPYFLSLCTLEPRKNLDMLLRSFLQLLLESPGTDICLVLAGSLGWDYQPIFQLVRNHPELQAQVVFTGYVADGDLAALYSGALAFVYPSLYEGFGLPPLEAMQCGTPVLASCLSALPEVVGDAGLLVDPRDGDALAQAMLNLASSDRLRQELVVRSLQRAQTFNWTQCAADTVAHCRRALAA